MSTSRDVVRLAERFPQLMQELWRGVATEDATAQQWLVNVGRRSALERMAHLLCEIYARCEATRLSTHDGCFFSISQVELADSSAISAVHVNRVLMELRKAGLVGLSKHRLTIPDVPALQAIAGFEVDYLQIAGTGRSLTELGVAELEGRSGQTRLTVQRTGYTAQERGQSDAARAPLPTASVACAGSTLMS